MGSSRWRCGQVVEVRAERLTPEGVLCRPLGAAGGGPALLVWGLFPGERGRVRLGARPAEARLLELIQAHPARRPPPCPRYREPSSCPLLCLEPEVQREEKEQMLRQSLAAAGLEEAAAAVLQPSRCPSSTGYRAKAVFAAAATESGQPRLGYFAPGSHRLRPGTDCLLHRPEIAALAGAVERAVRTAGLPVFDEGRPEGGLRFVTVRVSRRGDGWVLLTYRPATPEPLLQQAAALLLEPAQPLLRSVWCSRQEQSENAVVGGRPILLAGGDPVWEQVGSLAIPLEPGAFHQVNPEAGDLLVQAVVEAAEQARARRVLDLCCGAGAYALNLAALGLQATGVEREGEALDAARKAAAAAGLTVSWVEEDADSYVRRLAAAPWMLAAPPWDMVVLNPPRRGAAATLLDGLAALRPRLLVYVSCNPVTLARDLTRLLGAGYRLTSLRPVDLLPQTLHLETVAVLGDPQGSAGALAHELPPAGSLDPR